MLLNGTVLFGVILSMTPPTFRWQLMRPSLAVGT